MSKTLQVRMSDEEYEGLVEKAGGSGRRLAGYCREVLIGRRVEPVSGEVARVAEVVAKVEKPSADGRCSRCQRLGLPGCAACRG